MGPVDNIRRIFRGSQGSKGSASSTTNPTPQAPTPLENVFQSRGEELARNGDFNGAITMYNEALRSAPTDTVILLSRSLAYLMSTPPKLDLALQDANTAIEHSPTSWQAWQQKGETCRKMGDLQGAEDAFVNSEGCATGADKLAAQRSLLDLRALRAQHGARMQAVELPRTTIGILHALGL